MTIGKITFDGQDEHAPSRDTRPPRLIKARERAARGGLNADLSKEVASDVKVCDTLPLDDARVLWLAVLHALTMIVVALRKFLRVERCDTCGK